MHPLPPSLLGCYHPCRLLVTFPRSKLFPATVGTTTQGAIMQCLSAILHMGNMDFYEEGNEARPSDPNQMALVAQVSHLTRWRACVLRG